MERTREPVNRRRGGMYHNIFGIEIDSTFATTSISTTPILRTSERTAYYLVGFIRCKYTTAYQTLQAPWAPTFCQPPETKLGPDRNLTRPRPLKPSSL
jgi:hypothetical protein